MDDNTSNVNRVLNLCNIDQCIKRLVEQYSDKAAIMLQDQLVQYCEQVYADQVATVSSNEWAEVVHILLCSYWATIFDDLDWSAVDRRIEQLEDCYIDPSIYEI